MIEYLNNFSNVNTRNDNFNNSVCTQNIKNIMPCTRPENNIAHCPLSFHPLVPASHQTGQEC